jgi:NAD(P)-dependent dehydrogenase (short-subunit alcohol dehydrogenase family)
MSLEGRIAVITGGGGGIGRATAEAFAREGAAVLVADKDNESMHETIRRVRDAGGEANGIVTDVSVASDVQAMVRQATEQHGRLDFLFNNAGISGFSNRPMAEMDEATFDKLLAVNIKGVWLGMKYAIPVMIAQGGGVIVNTASTLGLVGQRLSGPFSATKHAVLGLTKTAAIEYGMRNVRVNAVCPGGIETPIAAKFKDTFTPDAWRERNEACYPATGRYGKPEEIAAAVLFLCSEAASNIHGIALPVDGGYTAQ